MDSSPERSLVAHRGTYRPSGRVEWPRVGWALVAAVVWSGIVTSFFSLLIELGYYLMALTVLLPAGLSAGLISWIVRTTHCRNRVLAGVLGGAMGLAGHAGYVHADQCLRWGVSWTAVDRLPGYLVFRMETDRWQFVDRGALLRPAQPAPGVIPWRGMAGVNFFTINWGLLLLDAGILLLVPLATGAYAAGQPYSESRRRWCDCERLTLAPAAGASLRAALAAGQIGEWVLSRPLKVGEHEAHVTISVWYTPRAQESDVDWDVFLAIAGGPRWRLAPEEAADLTVLLPSLQAVAEPTQERMSAEAAQIPGGAQIRPVPPPFAGLAQNRRTRAVGRAIMASAIVAPGVMVMVVLGGGTYLLTELASRPQPLIPEWIVPCYVVGAGLASLALVGYWFHPERQRWLELGRQFDHWLLRRAIRQRLLPLVAADDPAAIFVEMCPRRLFQAGQVADGEFNQGLLLVNWERERLLFEGDYACYEIPAAAIAQCQIEGFDGVSANTGGLFGVILQVELGTGVVELPLFPLRGLAGNRWQQAVELRARFELLCGREFGEQPSEPPPAPPLHVG